jgi:hypothetical protein
MPGDTNMLPFAHTSTVVHPDKLLLNAYVFACVWLFDTQYYLGVEGLCWTLAFPLVYGWHVSAGKGGGTFNAHRYRLSMHSTPRLVACGLLLFGADNPTHWIQFVASAILC